MSGANSTAVFFSSLCGRDNPFWDWDLSWYTSNPDLTICCLKIIPVWAPACLLLILAVLTPLFRPPAKRAPSLAKAFAGDPASLSSPASSSSSSSLPPTNCIQLIVNWRLWSIFFAAKLFALSCMVICAILGKTFCQIVLGF